MELNIIGDIAGCYETLLALIAKMPQDATVLSVGDMVDRGNDSAKVISWFMNRENKALALMGNHEHMMLHASTSSYFYDKGVWLQNGGTSTLRSFNYSTPKKVKEWLAALPLYHQIEGLIVTHAPINPVIGLKRACNLGQSAVDNQCEMSVIWNRGSPKKIDGVYQVFGHQSHLGLKDFGIGKPFATCIDTSRSRVLTGMHWPSRKIYQQEFIGVDAL